MHNIKVENIKMGKMYKGDYIKVNNAISLVNNAIASSPMLKDKILKEKLKPAKISNQHLNFAVFPTVTKMVSVILRKREDAYEEYDLRNPNMPRSEKIEKVAKWLDKNIVYDESVKYDL